MHGVECGLGVCIESGVQPGNYLTTEGDSRVAWRLGGRGLNHHMHVSIGGYYAAIYI